MRRSLPALLLAALLTAAADAPAPAPPASEPLWKSILLAPGRVVGHGRFDAARPSYHARRSAAEAAAAEKARSACRCAEGR
jgi:hypothetical protein